MPHLSNDPSVITLSTDEVYKVLSTLRRALDLTEWPLALKDLALELAGSKNLVSNYRGIILLSVISKVLETVLPRIYNHVFPYQNSVQHGFRHNSPCVTQMIQHVHFLASTLDSRGQVDRVYLDMAKAFDGVPHQKLSMNFDTLAFETHL